jgi:hypothetical protein
MACFALLFWHFSLGKSSPGLLSLARVNLPYGGSVFLIVFFLFPSAAALLFIGKTTKKAQQHGITWYEWFDLPHEERIKREGKSG